MNLPHISLLNFLAHLPLDAEIVFCQQGINQTTVDLPSSVQSLVSTDRLGNQCLGGRKILSAQNLTAAPVIKRRVALLFCPGAEKNTELLLSLHSHGCNQACFFDTKRSLWCLVSLRSKRSIRIRGSIEPFLAKVQRIRGGGPLVLLKILLKFWAKDLHDCGASIYAHEIGNCYIARVPQLRSFSTDLTPLMLFEENTLLQPGCTHDEIRTFGGGRSSHWNDDIYFSSTDNSDPNSNVRRYRWVRGASIPSTDPSSVANQHSGIGLFAQALPFPSIDLEEVFRTELPLNSPRGVELSGESPQGVGLYISSLGAGGAERQLCYVARALKDQGVKVSVFVPMQPEKEMLHYLQFMQDSGIDVHFVSSPHPEFNFDRLLSPSGFYDLLMLHQLPDYLRGQVWNLYTHLMMVRPRVLHCWLDQPNLFGGLAGWIAGIPKIVLSTRNLNPSHFPYIYFEWYQEWYARILRSPRVHLTGNSQAGVISYSHWLRYPSERCSVIHNGLDEDIIRRPSRNEIERFRSSVEVGPQDLLVVGVLRLSPEKRPLRFLRAIAELKKHYPNLKAILVGQGAMEPEVKEEIAYRNLQDTVQVLGRRHDVPLIIASSDLLVLTSLHEGFPNVLLEAQWLGIPVVTTDAGGCSEVVNHGISGFVCARDSFVDLVESCGILLGNQSMRERHGRAGHEWVKARFSLNRMIEHTLAMYSLRPSDFVNSSSKLSALDSRVAGM